MTKTFRTDELRSAKQAHRNRRLARRHANSDPFCSYLLGPIDAEGRHAQAADPQDRTYHMARAILDGINTRGIR